jgi:hypothetical protein
MRIELSPGMKPGDHPEFFRLPPPPGRSRESRIVLDAEGRFWNGEQPIEHAGMATAFASWIRKHPDDGRFILANGYDWTYFTVVDVPFFVKGVESRGPGRPPILRLSDGTEEPLDAASVTASEAGVLYARVKGGEFEARFTPAAQSALVDVVVEGEDGEPCLEVLGERYRVAPRRG